MTKKKERNGLYAVAVVWTLLVIVFIYSCSTDEYYADKTQTEVIVTAQTRGFSLKTMGQEDTLIDSVAVSNEFWEFEMSSQLLADKFHDYTSKLSQEEYDKLMENLNDDDYMEGFIKKANLENVLQQMVKAKENLTQHTGFLKLSENERMQLFTQYAESSQPTGAKLLKTRNEGGETNSCEEQKQAAYKQAKIDYDNAIVKCKFDSTTSSCTMLASAKYDREKRIANKEYDEYMGHKS